MLSDENRNGTQKTQVYMPSRGMNAQKSDLISDPDVGKAFEYYAQYPGVMQGSQEGKRAKLWGPPAHFGANISMKTFSGSAAPAEEFYRLSILQSWTKLATVMQNYS